ncbi:RHS repeat domain-containing protein [Xylanibacter ruminicola]|nr:RHS repeat-associated core domain-containing protein [Xylanibacter ruminicola]
MKNGKIDKYFYGGGYAQASVASATTDNFAFYFYNQDHLGSIREVVDASGAVKQVNNYYPFGAPYADAPASTNADFQPYKYNGKELDKMHGLNTFDYGARQYDPILARWDRNDPLCEKYYDISPYAYCGNSPIKQVDSNGEEPTTYEAALMAKHVYGENVKLAGKWHLSKNQKESFNTKSGLRSALYERTINKITEYAYVTAGTEDIKDAQEDIKQLYGASRQYRESVDNAKQLNETLANSELTYVGHSLGGGLAAANALATDRNAITFNAAAISKNTKNLLRLPTTTSKGRIFNIVVKGEIVNYLQSMAGLKLEGGAFLLNAKYLPGINCINTVMRIGNHSINTIIQRLEEEKTK